MEAEVDVVVVGYYSGKDLDVLFEDLPKACKMPYHLHFFDNSGNPKTLTRCWNDLAFAGNAQYIAFLNVDIRLSPAWDKRLVTYLETYPELGIVLPFPVGHGWPTEIDPNAKSFPDPATAPAPTFADMTRIARKYARKADEKKFAKVFDKAFYLALLKRETFEALEGFDERFRYYGQDHDLQRRMFSRFGKYTAHARRARVWHRCGGSRREAEKRREVFFHDELKHMGTVKSRVEDGRFQEWDRLSNEERNAIRNDPLYARMPRKALR